MVMSKVSVYMFLLLSSDFLSSAIHQTHKMDKKH